MGGDIMTNAALRYSMAAANLVTAVELLAEAFREFAAAALVHEAGDAEEHALLARTRGVMRPIVTMFSGAAQVLGLDLPQQFRVYP